MAFVDEARERGSEVQDLLGGSADELLRRLLAQLVQEAIDKEFERFLTAVRLRKCCVRISYSEAVT